MRRVLAQILVCVIFLTTFQDLTILKAAPNTQLGFEVTREMLKEDATGLSKGERDDKANESALVKFEAGTAAQYDLEYYIEAQENNQTVTKKVKLNFNNVDKKKVELGISVSEAGSGTNDTLSYVERVFNNTNFTWEQSSTALPDTQLIQKELYLGTDQSRENQEFNIEITSIRMQLEGNKQDNLKLRIKAIGEEIYVYTNGIAKGNITPFNLYYANSTTPIASFDMFNGPKDYAIKPTHLYLENGQLKSLELIEDITQIKPGSVPGVKVEFNQIKKISGDKFDYVHNINGGADSNITLQLGTRYTLGSMSNSIRLDFTPVDNAGVKVDLKDVSEYSSNVIQVENNVVSLYLSQTELAGLNDPKVIAWDVLETSTIVDGSLQYENQAEKYWPSNKGYTYLGYTLHKTTSNQVQINIQPYNIKSRATYSIYILNNKDTDRTTPSVVYEYDPNKTETTNITAIVPAGSPSYFQVVVTIDSNTFESQMVFYDPAAFPATPETTQIKTIENVYVVPNEVASVEGAQPQAIGFDMTWTAPKNVAALLKDGKLYYELLLRKDPKDYDPITNTGNSTEDIYATYSKIFEVSLNSEGKVVVNTVAGTAGKEKNNTPELRYSEVNDTFSMENISLMNFGAVNNKWEQLEINENHLSTTSGGYLANIVGTEADSLSNRLVPGTYYLSFRTVLVSNTDTTPVVYSEESNMVALSLDNTNEIIPVPNTITGEDISAEDKKVISEKVSIKNVDIRNYVRKMLEPAHLYLYKDLAHTTGRFSGEYEIYLYQKAAQLASTISGVEKGTITPIKLSKDQNKITLNDSNAYIEKLRQGGVIPISLSVDSLIGQGDESIELIGLDPNEVYYIQVRVKLSPWRDNLAQAGKEIPSRYSLFSKEFTFTTTTVPLPPTEEDKVPPTPEKIWVEEQPNNTTVTLGWAPAKFEEDEDVTKTYYEFIRTELKLTEDEEAKTVEELIAADSNRVGFRSDSPTTSNPFMSTYTGKDKTWTNLDPAQEASKFLLTDTTLNPNAVYYYYVRTVCMIDGKAIKSTWIMVPVTTAPVLGPINLKVELTKDYPYDAKNETVISFDAPVPSDSSVPSDYDFDIAVQGEMDSEYSTTKYSVTKLTSKADSSLTPEGYTHFVYKITDLKPNKRYFIKVRVVDKTKPVTNGGSYPTSLYCDKVTTRTEYDEDEANKDNKYEEYLEKYEAEAEKLRRRPYWEVEEDAVYKYRESYIKTEVGLQSEYELVVGEDAEEAYYYMPASVFTNSDMQTVLKITLGDYTANIRPYTLTETHEQVKKAIDLVSEDSIEDYYVGISFDLTNTTTRINGQSSISPQMSIEMELVYVRDKEIDIEEDILVALNELIEAEKEDVIEELEEEIYDGTIADDVLTEIIEDALADVEEAHMKKVERILDRTTKREVSIDEIEKPILLVAKLDHYAVDAYYLANNWSKVDSYAVGNGFAIEAKMLGNYIFTGQVSLITVAPSLAPYQSFIAKYNLTDFFTINSYTVKNAVTKEQLYGAVARIIGAARGTDYVVYLKNNGVKGVNSIGKTNAIRQDEAIYLVMQGYEKVHKRSVNSIMIKNRQSVKNIGAFQSVYRPYVYAAVELKIVSNTNSKVTPSKQMSIEEIIAMLYKIQV